VAVARGVGDGEGLTWMFGRGVLVGAYPARGVRVTESARGGTVPAGSAVAVGGGGTVAVGGAVGGGEVGCGEGVAVIATATSCGASGAAMAVPTGVGWAGAGSPLAPSTTNASTPTTAIAAMNAPMAGNGPRPVDDGRP
jgi:hypothetical protein